MVLSKISRNIHHARKLLQEKKENKLTTKCRQPEHNAPHKGWPEAAVGSALTSLPGSRGNLCGGSAGCNSENIQMRDEIHTMFPSSNYYLSHSFYFFR